MAKKEYIRIQSVVSPKIGLKLRKLAKKRDKSVSGLVFEILVGYFEGLANESH